MLRKEGLKVEYDLAIILMGDFNDKEVKAIAKKPISVCSSGTKGETVTVFGYPDAAYSNDVTLASGIISNVEESYYLTDANIGPGNSGGVVVKKEENCYLGVPILISRGSKVNSEGEVEYFESWGVILKASILNYDKSKGFSF